MHSRKFWSTHRFNELFYWAKQADPGVLEFQSCSANATLAWSKKNSLSILAILGRKTPEFVDDGSKAMANWSPGSMQQEFQLKITSMGSKRLSELWTCAVLRGFYSSLGSLGSWSHVRQRLFENWKCHLRKMRRVRNCQHPQLEGAKWYQMPSILVNLGPWWDKLAWTMGQPWYSCLALRMPFSYGAFCSYWTKRPSPTTPKIRRLRNTGCWNGRVLSSFGMDHSPTFGAQDMSLIHWHCLDYSSYGLLKIMSTCCG